MIEFTEYLRDSHAQHVLVNKFGGIYRVNQNIMKCIFVLASPGAGGIITAVERVSLMWETTTFTRPTINSTGHFGKSAVERL